jgi:hypothetical protein
MVQVLIQQSFAAEELHVDAEVTHSTIQGQHPCPKMPPSEAVNAYGVSEYGPNVESGPLTGSRPLASLKGREELPAHN